VSRTFDYVVIGGGIVGLSTAWQLLSENPGKTIAIIEKEAVFGKHQTGHNSGVIHAGIYYEPGSLKAQFCREGLEQTISFCQAHDIEYQQCGKLLVATNVQEQQRMLALFERAQKNGLEVELLDAQALKKREPNVQGLGAIWVKKTGIVDYLKVCEQLAKCFVALGGVTLLNTKVLAIAENSDEVVINTDRNPLRCQYLISCAGLMADRITAMMNINTDFQIIPFRGEYYRLNSDKKDIVKHLIYPIPDPELPFLGVHLTPMISGEITVGPNAVQGWKREGYGKLNISLKDTWQMLNFTGFWLLLKNHFKTGLVETKNSLYKPGYLKLVQKYCNSITINDLKPYPAGIRAQAVMKDGSLVHDFLFAQSPRSLHVCNAPSPAATSAMPIGKHIVGLVMRAEMKRSGVK